MGTHRAPISMTIVRSGRKLRFRGPQTVRIGCKLRVGTPVLRGRAQTTTWSQHEKLHTFKQPTFARGKQGENLLPSYYAVDVFVWICSEWSINLHHAVFFLFSPLCMLVTLRLSPIHRFTASGVRPTSDCESTERWGGTGQWT